MVAIKTVWLLGERWLLRETQFFKTYIFKTFYVFFLSWSTSYEIQSIKKCLLIKTTIEIHFLLLWQLRFYRNNKNKNEIKTIRNMEQI